MNFSKIAFCNNIIRAESSAGVRKVGLRLRNSSKIEKNLGLRKGSRTRGIGYLIEILL